MWSGFCRGGVSIEVDMSLNEARIDLAGHELLMIENALEERNRGLGGGDHDFAQTTPHAPDGLEPVTLVDDQLTDQ